MILLIIIITALILYITFWIPSYITRKDNYKYYKPTYEAIKNKEYVLLSNTPGFEDGLIIFRHKETIDTIPKWSITDDEIIYFRGTKSIKLTKGYIHKTFIPFFEPYTNYWYHKIKEQIMANSSIENMRDYKLKQLNIK